MLSDAETAKRAIKGDGRILLEASFQASEAQLSSYVTK
jgi:hypothetical protein